jgi:bacterioferritin-associated ferredoxin
MQSQVAGSGSCFAGGVNHAGASESLVAVASMEDLKHAIGLGAPCGLCLDCAIHLAFRAMAAMGWVSPSVANACIDCRCHWDNGYRHDDTHSARPHGEKAGCWKNGSGLLLTSVRGSSDSCLRSIIESVTFDLRGSNLCCDVVIWVCPVYRSVLGHSRLRIKLKSLASHDRR